MPKYGFDIVIIMEIKTQKNNAFFRNISWTTIAFRKVGNAFVSIRTSFGFFNPNQQVKHRTNSKSIFHLFCNIVVIRVNRENAIGHNRSVIWKKVIFFRHAMYLRQMPSCPQMFIKKGKAEKFLDQSLRISSYIDENIMSGK